MAPAKKVSSKHVESDANVERDELALFLQKELNKSNKDGSKVSYFLDENDNPSQITEWVSTGSTLLDLAVSNIPHGGLPVGRMVELSGLESTGKSLICAQIIAETQRQGGLSVFFDSEFSVDKNFWVALGINVKNVNYVPFTTLEEFFNKFELCIGAFRKKCPDRLLTILVDSVTQASVEKEMESEHGIDGYNTGRAIVISKAMRKCTGLIARQRILPVFTNQVRYNMNAGPFGDKWIVPGGKALPFACSIRIRFANLGKLTKNDEVIGMKCQAQVIKNRCGPCYRTAAFEVHYDSGIQDLTSWLQFMKKYGIITGDGHGYEYKLPSGEKLEFNTPKFVELMNTDAALKEEIYMAICDKYIMQYRNPNSKIVEDVVETNTENDDITKNAVKEE
jgi:recombination protein RecA